MTRSLPFALIDVFASEPLTGNPLALIPHADELDEERMKAIAREFNQSETTFLLTPTLPGVTWRLRSFTAAGVEVLGAGHNAMGAWIWLAETGQLPPGEDIFAQQIGGEVLPVRVTREPAQPSLVSMDQSPPTFGQSVTDRQVLARSLALDDDDLVANKPAQVVSTGVGHLLVAVRDRTVVDRTAPEPARLVSVLREVGGEGCYVYSRDPVDPAGGSVAYARFFNPTVGIVEDPATGTAAGPLVAALTAAAEIPPGTAAVVEQGYALGRPSRLRITVQGRRVSLRGSGLVVADGVLHL